MASNYPPKKNVAFTMYFFVHKSDGTIIANPTLTGSNVHVDGNTTEVTDSTLAVVDSTTGLCSIVLAQATMNGDQIDGTVTSSSTGAVVKTFKLMTAANTQDEIGTDLAATQTTIINRLGASVVTVTSPVSVDASTVTLVCGDDYYDADGRALMFTDSGGTFPAFTAGTCKFTVRDLAKGTDTETAGTIVDANTVRFELTKTATGAWTAGGKYRFDVEVTLVSGHEVTVATGVVIMLAKYSG